MTTQSRRRDGRSSFRRLRKRAPRWIAFVYRILKNPGDVISCIGFVLAGPSGWPIGRRFAFVCRALLVSYHVDCAHTEREILTFAQVVASLPDDLHGCIVEAGCYKGGGTAKLSLLASLLGRRLKVFDSFRGIPPNSEMHGRDIFGIAVDFPQRAYTGSLAAVKSNVAKYGRLDVCDFVEGWFDDTLPQLSEPIAAAYLDVDLAASTRTCIRYLYPHLADGGVLASQDGHLPLVLDVFRDRQFWQNEVGCPAPDIYGLGSQKLITMRKGPVSTGGSSHA